MKDISEGELTNSGERMIVGNMWGYWAHLSIYHFASTNFVSKFVLDVGSGSGYGSAYLARHGSKVLGIDASEVAINHSRIRYAGDNVTFEIIDLNHPLPFGERVYDLVFSSNVFEHIPNIDLLISECARVIKRDGVAIIAVPPIDSASTMSSDMDNHFHVHHIPPTAWKKKLERFFTTVECHAHTPGGRFPTTEQHQEQMSLPADRVEIRETDFDFPNVAMAEDLADGKTITAIYVCRAPRQEYGPETIDERTPAAWNETSVAAAKISQLRDEISARFAQVSAAETRAADLATKEQALSDALRQSEAARNQAQEQNLQLAAQLRRLERSPLGRVQRAWWRNVR